MFSRGKKSWERVADRILLEFIKIGDADTAQSDSAIKEKTLYNLYNHPKAFSSASSLSSIELNNNYERYIETEKAFKKSETYKRMTKDQNSGLHPTSETITNCVVDALFIENNEIAIKIAERPELSKEFFVKIYEYIDTKIRRGLQG